MTTDIAAILGNIESCYGFTGRTLIAARVSAIRSALMPKGIPPTR